MEVSRSRRKLLNRRRRSRQALRMLLMQRLEDCTGYESHLSLLRRLVHNFDLVATTNPKTTCCVLGYSTSTLHLLSSALNSGYLGDGGSLRMCLGVLTAVNLEDYGA